MRRSARRTLAPLVLVAALGLTACGSDDPAEFDQGQGTGTAQEQATEEGTEAPTGDGGEAQTDAATDATDDPASSVVVDPTDVIAETSYPAGPPGWGPEQGGTITVGVHSLRVEGETMLLELYFTLDVPDAGPDEAWNLFAMHGGQTLYPVLNDRENLKQYVLLQDPEDAGATGRWSTDTTNGGAAARSGDTITWWGYFPAPQDDIDSIGVSVVPGAAEFDAIPIER